VINNCVEETHTIREYYEEEKIMRVQTVVAKMAMVVIIMVYEEKRNTERERERES
jgi:hypothetical protein